MTDMRPVICQNCGWKGTVGQCEPIDPRYLPERVPAGGIMPAGECPVCGASAMLDEDKAEPSRGPCITIVTTREPERATHFGVRTTAQALADVMAMAANTCTYRVQDISGFRVTVYRQSPYPRMVPDAYLRILPA